MSYGLPVVAARVEGSPEAIVDSVAGLVVAPGSPAGSNCRQSGELLERVKWNFPLSTMVRADQELVEDLGLAGDS